ncbi:hypothetical protein M9Y10_036300 [Tritrichomonas musculus]|uniref:Small GTP-binding protein n=1 Tax=Tritrichomonas musculus TaxID=1915356 RepID=A0ABR2GW19_9EUKA
MSIKAVFLGGPGVGKSSIIKYYSEGHADSFHRPTISAGFVQKDCEYEGKKFEFGIWDTAGAEQFRSIAPIYFRNANLAFIVADASDPTTDNDAKFWAEEVISKADEDVKLIFVMNKIDLITDNKSVESRAHALASQYGDYYSLTSALVGTGVNELFVFSFGLITDVINKLESGEESDHNTNANVKLDDNHQTNEKKKSCC